MKTLILNGSPRRNGDTVALINELKKHLQGEIIVVSAYYDNISACLDCRHCWTTNSCAIKDDMQKVYDAIEKVDNVIIASPIYISQLTGKLLDLASRFQVYFASKLFMKKEIKVKKKKGLLILTGGGNGSYKPAEQTANVLFKEMNCECIGVITSLNTDNCPASEDVEALENVKKFADLLNKC